MKISLFSWRVSIYSFIVFLSALLLFSIKTSKAEDVPVITNQPLTLSANVTPGTQMINIPFDLSGVNGLILEVIVPVNGALFTLVDPSGNIIYAPGDSEVTFTAGTELVPESSLPGGVFVTQEIIAPANGIWSINIEFPPATETTVILATIFKRTDYQVGITLSRESYLTGEETSIGLIVLEGGIPILGLSPEIKIFIDGSNTPDLNMIGLDNGLDADGLIDDGIYSIEYIFPQAGEYLIKCSVTIPTSEGNIYRETSRTIKVSDPPVTVLNVSANIVYGSGNCVSGIEEKIDLLIQEPGEYFARGTLVTDGTSILEKRAKETLSAGTQTLVIFYSSEEILDILGEKESFSFKELDILSFQNEEFILAARNSDLQISLSLGLNPFCRNPIEIGTGLTVDTVLDNEYIESLIFGIPINVQAAGSYQISAKIVALDGSDIELVGFTEYLAEGNNIAKFSIQAERFQKNDGPYSVISVLVIGSGGSAQQAQVGESPTFSRWQFLPTIEGDLDNDGDVDADDRSLILESRNSTALSPGDRRDINRDGKIDLRDARAIIGLR